MKLLVSFILLILSSLTYADNPIVLQDTPLREFVSWYSEETGKTVLLEPHLKINLNAYAPQVTKDSLDEFFIALLNAHNLSVIKEENNLVVKTKVIAPPFEPEEEPEEEPEAQLKTTFVHTFKKTLADDLLDFAQTFASDDDKATNKRDNNNLVQVLRSLNALVMTTTEEKQATFIELMQYLDTSRPLVYLEAIIFEDSTANGLDLGLGFGQTQRDSNGIVGGFNTGNLNNLATNGLSFGILSEETLKLTLNAIENNSEVQILSKPQILIISGEEGLISVGQNVPFITSTTININNSTQSIERRDVGVSLTVQPFVTQGKTIILNLALTADSINQSLKASDIITNTRNLKTKIRLQEGETLRLGGLVTKEQEEQVKKVPFLGSIPLLGALFRSTSTNTTFKELNIMLKASSIN